MKIFIYIPTSQSTLYTAHTHNSLPVEITKELELFVDEADLQETIDF